MTAQLDRARVEIASFGRRMIERGLAIGSAGNISVRIGDAVLISPAGVPYVEIGPSDICLIDLSGEQLSGDLLPSSETPMHLAIYEATDANAIIHTHSPEVVAASSVLDELPAVHYAIVGLGGPVRVVPYVRFGSDELARRTRLALEGRSAAILQNHGAIAYGGTLAEAFDRALLLEWLAGVYRKAVSLGTPRILDASELEEVLAESRRRRYGQRQARLSSQRNPLLGPVVTIGSHILDVLGRPVDHIPPKQGSLILEEIRATAAGTAAGCCVGLAKLGVDVSTIGVVGTDALGDILVALMTNDGVKTNLIIRREAVPTTSTILPIRSNGERPALHAPGADRTLAFEDLTDEHWRALSEAKVLHIGAPERISALAISEFVHVVRRARSDDTIVTLDVLDRGCAELLQRLTPLLAEVDWFLPNEDQLRNLTGEDDLDRACNVVRELGVKGVAVTRGAEGCLVVAEGLSEELPALQVKVVDTTGCGDAFNAGFIVGLLLGWVPAECAWLGEACGALVAMGLGSNASLVSLNETLGFLNDQRPRVGRSVS